VRARWSTALRGEGGADRAVPRRSEGKKSARRERLGVLAGWAREAERERGREGEGDWRRQTGLTGHREGEGGEDSRREKALIGGGRLLGGGLARARLGRNGPGGLK
jgi:hypothetical protein